MVVPGSDIVCRFVRVQDWNFREGRPKTGAFKGADLSVWRVGKLRDNAVEPRALCIDTLDGAGEAHHMADDYLGYAQQASTEELSFTVQVKSRTGEKHVWEAWRQWGYAHAEVEASIDHRDIPLKFRELLALNAREVREPSRGTVGA